MCPVRDPGPRDGSLHSAAGAACRASCSRDLPEEPQRWRRATCAAGILVKPIGAAITVIEGLTLDPPSRRLDAGAQNSWSIQGIIVAEVLADLLDLVAGGLLAHAVEVLAAGAVLGDPLLGELARLDVGEDLLHRRARLVADHRLPRVMSPYSAVLEIE